MQYKGDRIAFEIFGIPVYWYAILIVTGMLLAILGASKEYKRSGGDEETIVDLAMWVLPSAVVGSRLWYVIFEWERFGGSLTSILDIRSGGLAIQGGIIAGALVGYVFTKRKNLKFYKLADVIMIFLPLAQAIGRWGNFINNEAYGAPTDLPWAVIIEGQTYHPTFLYESLGNMILFLFLWYFYRKKQTRDGQTTALYLIGYGIIRFFVEGLRMDSLYFGSIRVAQALSFAFIVVGIFLYFIRSKHRQMTQQNELLLEDKAIEDDMKDK